MRSAVTDGSAASRWSLLALIQLLVGIEGRVLAPRPLLREPRVEARGDETVGALLFLRRADGEEVGVLVFDVLVMTPHPAPVHGMMRRDLRERLPQLEVLECAGLAAPALRLPAGQPFVHPFDEILRIGDEADMCIAPLAPGPFERRNRAGDRHAVVRRLRGAVVEIPPRDAVARGCLDRRCIAAAARLARVVAEAALVGVNEYEGCCVAHGSITTGILVWSRISSACDAVTSAR